MLLAEIGQKLKTAREAKGFTLSHIYERTKIPPGHLEAIESGRDEDLPESVYVAGFIRLYGEQVGLDGQELSDSYRQDAKASEPGGQLWFPQAQPAYSKPEYLAKSRLNQEPPTFKTIYFNAICIVAVVAIISFLTWTQVNNQAGQQDPALIKLREAALKAGDGDKQPGGMNGGGKAAPDTEGQDARVALTASQHVWVDVQSVKSGNSLFTGFMEQGDRRDFQDSEGLKVRAGNGGSLTVDFRGKIKSLGKPGVAAEQSFLSSSATPGESEAPAEAAGARTSVSASPRTDKPGPMADRSKLARQRDYRTLEDVHSRQYIPGEALGTQKRAIDVPYRFSEGRLDVD